MMQLLFLNYPKFQVVWNLKGKGFILTFVLSQFHSNIASLTSSRK